MKWKLGLHMGWMWRGPGLSMRISELLLTQDPFRATASRSIISTGPHMSYSLNSLKGVI